MRFRYKQQGKQFNEDDIMLLISRRVGEVVYIYPPDDLPEDMTVSELFEEGQIAIEVKEIKGTQVRIGIDAPQNLSILRDDAKSIKK